MWYLTKYNASLLCDVIVSKPFLTRGAALDNIGTMQDVRIIFIEFKANTEL
jgi:hypothetical protein